jgi:hypothetical protein
MQTRKKPSMRGAVIATGAAIWILPLSLLERTDSSQSLLPEALVLLGWMMITVGAIMQWVEYFQRWVRFEIENHEERTKTEK